MAGFWPTISSTGVGYGFLRARDGSFTTIELTTVTPAAAGGDGPFSINLFGAVTGIFIDAGNADHGFSRSARGEIATFNAKDAGTSPGQGTRPSTNNIYGEVTGWYIDSNNLGHGFIAIP